MPHSVHFLQSHSLHLHRGMLSNQGSVRPEKIPRHQIIQRLLTPICPWIHEALLTTPPLNNVIIQSRPQPGVTQNANASQGRAQYKTAPKAGYTSTCSDGGHSNEKISKGSLCRHRLHINPWSEHGRLDFCGGAKIFIGHGSNVSFWHTRNPESLSDRDTAVLWGLLSVSVTAGPGGYKSLFSINL